MSKAEELIRLPHLAGSEDKRMHRFGLDGEAYHTMLAAQHSQCAICRKPLDAQDAVIDHDHSTGALRALLCRKCNSGLGFFDDSPRALWSAARYVIRHRAASHISRVKRVSGFLFCSARQTVREHKIVVLRLERR